jgi:hypothetical protein
VNQRGPPAGRNVDERAQPAGRGDASRERDPDPERRREDGEREEDDERRRVDAVTGRPGEDREQRNRAADRCDREAEEERAGKRSRSGIPALDGCL